MSRPHSNRFRQAADAEFLGLPHAGGGAEGRAPPSWDIRSDPGSARRRTASPGVTRASGIRRVASHRCTPLRLQTARVTARAPERHRVPCRVVGARGSRSLREGARGHGDLASPAPLPVRRRAHGRLQRHAGVDVHESVRARLLAEDERASRRVSYRVLLVNSHLAPLPVAFRVTVLHGSKIVSVEEGSIAAIRQQWGPKTTNWK